MRALLLAASLAAASVAHAAPVHVHLPLSPSSIVSVAAHDGDEAFVQGRWQRFYRWRMFMHTVEDGAGWSNLPHQVQCDIIANEWFVQRTVWLQ